MRECETTVDSLGLWLQDEQDGLNTDDHQRLGAHIEECPSCTQCVDALRRVDQMSAGLVSAEVAVQQEDTDWLDQLMNNLVLETRAGRSVPLTAEFEVDNLSITEGAILAAIRGVADSMENLIIGRCRLEGNVETPGSPITIQASAMVRYGVVIEDVANRLRELITTEIQRVSEINIEAINIEVHDIFGAPQEGDK